MTVPTTEKFMPAADVTVVSSMEATSARLLLVLNATERVAAID